jgi:serine/threonine protein kinase
MAQTSAVRSRSSPQATAPPAVSLIAHRGNKKLYRVNTSTMDIDDRYDVVSVLGRGSYGVVAKCDDSISGQALAIKKVEHLFSDLIDGRRIWREIVVLRLLREAKARNVIELKSLMRPSEEMSKFQDLYIVTPLYDGEVTSILPSTLANVAQLRTRAPRPTASDGLRCVLADMLTGLADLHAIGVVHRDIKPQNILVDSNQCMRLCDFGLARGGVERMSTVPANLTDHVVTRWYRPPELLIMAGYHYSVDVFGAGCVAGEVLLKKPLFQGRDYLEQLRLVVLGLHPDGDVDTTWIKVESARRFINGCYRKSGPSQSTYERLVAGGATSTVANLIVSLCAFNPAERPTASAALGSIAIRDLVVPHPDKDLLQPSATQDWSIDALPEVPEPRLRRAIWDEILRYGAHGTASSPLGSGSGSGA